MQKVYQIDIVTELLTRLGSQNDSAPVFFQRDMRFYVASPAGFGYVNHGLDLHPEDKGRVERGYVKEKPEILASEDITYIKPPKEKYDSAKTCVKKSEIARVGPIVFGSDEDSFNLESMATTAETLGKLKDDGKIRLVNHNNRYHSHKYGYAADGMDFWLEKARVMDREKYFELMRQDEETLLKGLEELSIPASKEPEFSGNELNQKRPIIEMAYDGSGIGRMGYKPFSLMDAVVITPNFAISFPRAGSIDYHDRDKTWTSKTEFSSRKGVLHFRGVETREESPFDVTFILNSQRLYTKTPQEFKTQANQLSDSISQGIKAVQETMPLMEQYVARLNEMNNLAFEPCIEGRSKIMSEARANKKRREASATR